MDTYQDYCSSDDDRSEKSKRLKLCIDEGADVPVSVRDASVRLLPTTTQHKPIKVNSCCVIYCMF